MRADDAAPPRVPFWRTATGQNLVRIGAAMFTLGIVLYLVDQISQIGWLEVWEEAPTTTWFYILFGLMYLTLPTFESIVYSILWNVPPHRSFLALLKKRVYSRSLIDYSGEAYLYLWARQRVDLPERQLLATIKDSVLVSVAASTAVAGVLLGGLLLGGLLILPADLTRPYISSSLAIVLGVATLGFAAFKFRHHILFLPTEVLKKIMVLHVGRLLLLQVLQVAQWMVVYPDVPLQTWFTLLAAQLVLYRIPFLPQRDLVFMGVGLQMAQWIDFTTASMAGLLLTVSVLEKVANLLSVGLATLVEGGKESSARRSA